MAYYFGIDIGTSGTKTVLYDLQGRAVASALEEYPLYQPQNGWAEQDPEDWWQAVVTTIQRVLAESGIQAAEVKGLGLSGQMHGLVMLDESGSVLRRSIIWADQRTAAEVDDLNRIVGHERMIRITANPAITGFTAAKILWVRKNEPDIFNHCRKILLPKDYIRYRLTGEYATEVSDASGMQLLDIGARDWSDELLELLDLDRSLLADVYESVEVSGRVSEMAAELTGLEVGMPLVGGAGDNAAAAIGTGVVTEGRAFTTIGTSGVVFAHTDEMHIDPKGRVHTFCAAVPGAWHVMSVTQAAGLSLKWFRDEFCANLNEIAEAEGQSVYAYMDSLAAEVPIGSERLLYLPYLMGERTPWLDPDARGVFFGLSAMHKQAHLTRAIMEGVSFSQRDGLEIMRGMGLEVDDMRATGGGASPFWRQMLADVYGVPVATLTNSGGGTLGVALLAMVGTGAYATIQEACDATIRLGEGSEADAEHTARYDRVYALYTDLYPKLKDSFQVLKEI